MVFMKSDIRRVGIIAKPKLTSIAAVVSELTQWFVARGMDVVLDAETAIVTAEGRTGVPRSEVPSQCDLIVVLGGDGTLLSVARAMNCETVPILAVNFGSLGFLTEITLEETFHTLTRILDGKATTQKRLMVDVTVNRKGSEFARYRALNDVVVTKGALARIIDIDVRIDSQFVATYKADGLIVATPTGSTAYTLSAGGPIVFPTMAAMLITPIASHTLTFRTVVIPDTALVELGLKATQESVYLTVDGQVGLALNGDDVLQVGKSAQSIELVESANKNFFDILRQKLKWGER